MNEPVQPDQATRDLEERRLSLEARRLDAESRHREGSILLDHKRLRADVLRSLAVALIAAAVPVAALVNGIQQLKIESQRSQEEIGFRFLSLIINPDHDAARQERILRFVIETFPPTHAARRWAEKELPAVLEVNRLTIERAELRQNFEEAQALLAAERRQRESENLVATAREQQLLERVDALQVSLDEIDKRIETGEREAGLTPSPRPAGQCCVFCGGDYFCGVTVQTECGSCEAPAARSPVITRAFIPSPPEIIGLGGGLDSVVFGSDGYVAPPQVGERLEIRGTNLGKEPGIAYFTNSTYIVVPLTVLAWSNSRVSLRITEQSMIHPDPELVGLTRSDGAFADYSHWERVSLDSRSIR